MSIILAFGFGSLFGCFIIALCQSSKISELESENFRLKEENEKLKRGEIDNDYIYDCVNGQ